MTKRKFEYDLYEKDPINYDEDIVIDEYNLHIEWVRHGETTKKYIRYYHKAKYLMDEAYKKLKFIKADLDHKIRHDPEGYDLVKLTDPIVKEAVIRQKEYQKAEQEWIDAKYEAEMAADVLEDMRDKKWRLQEIGKLVEIGYFVDPDVPKQFTAGETRKRVEQVKDTAMSQSIMEEVNKKDQPVPEKKNIKQIKYRKDG